MERDEKRCAHPWSNSSARADGPMDLSRSAACSSISMRHLAHQPHQIAFGVTKKSHHKSCAGIRAMRCGSSSKCTPLSFILPNADRISATAKYNTELG